MTHKISILFYGKKSRTTKDNMVPIYIRITVNRIGFDRRTVSDSNNYKKIASYCRKMELQYNLQEVLSPRQFLSEKQRAIPRHDSRKAQIKEHIRECLAVSRSYEDFERLMKEKRYEVIKGRGIAFRDEKKVYAKGSELGYSLKKIECLLEQNKMALNQPSKRVELKPESTPANQQLTEKENRNLSSVDDLAKQFPNKVMMDHLLNPEQTNMQMPYELTHAKKKKKRGQKPQQKP